MKEVDLRSVDLNLLVVLQALLSLRHISQAAKQLNMSQPAVSRALSRLRESFDDELLVRTQSGYQLTERAKRLEPSLDRVLGEVSQMIKPVVFEPSKTTQTLYLTGVDLELLPQMSQLAKRLFDKAPKLKVEIVQLAGEHFKMLDSGDVHFCVSGFSPDFADDQFHRMKIGEFDSVAVMDENNPRATGLTLENYLTAAHGLVSITGKGPGVIDDQLKRMGLKRRVNLRLTSFMSVGEFCEGSDLIFALPRPIANALAQHRKIALTELPSEIQMPNIILYLYWHHRHHNDPLCRWVRKELFSLLEEARR
ncbi:MAG: LysR family transcriptional regulator [Pontibacterium sp.]